MVAYSFSPRFIAPIEAGTKLQTIRADRKRHARPGEGMSLYTGMRTKKCRLIRIVVCESVAPIRIFVSAGWIEFGIWRIGIDAGIDEFARADGFEDWHDMRAFWREHHPNVDVFSGVLIRWTI